MTLKENIILKAQLFAIKKIVDVIDEMDSISYDRSIFSGETDELVHRNNLDGFLQILENFTKSVRNQIKDQNNKIL